MNLRFSDIKKHLTFSYDDYNNRQLLYDKVIKQFFTDLIPDPKQLTPKQRHWTEELDLFVLQNIYINIHNNNKGISLLIRCRDLIISGPDVEPVPTCVCVAIPKLPSE